MDYNTMLHWEEIEEEEVRYELGGTFTFSRVLFISMRMGGVCNGRSDK